MGARDLRGGCRATRGSGKVHLANAAPICDNQDARFALHGPTPRKLATPRQPVRRVHWCRSTGLVLATYGVTGGGLPEFAKPSCLGLSMSADTVLEILAEAKTLARRYRALTGKPLGITGEVAEYEAARILGVELTPARQAGYDAIETRDGQTVRLQIKGRCVLEGSKPGQRMGSIDIRKEFDAVLLVLLDGNLEATAIYEAPRQAVIAALMAPGSKSRNERGALGISKFKSIGAVRWLRSA